MINITAEEMLKIIISKGENMLFIYFLSTDYFLRQWESPGRWKIRG